MNKAHAAAHVSVPFAVVVGVSLATLAVVGTGHDEIAAAPKPAPTVTATVTAPVPAPGRTTVVARPGTSHTAADVVPVSESRAAIPHTGSGGLSHKQARPPSAPKPPAPKPSPSSPAAAPCSGVLTVRLLQACVSLGR